MGKRSKAKVEKKSKFSISIGIILMIFGVLIAFGSYGGFKIKQEIDKDNNQVEIVNGVVTKTDFSIFGRSINKKYRTTLNVQLDSGEAEEVEVVSMKIGDFQGYDIGDEVKLFQLDGKYKLNEEDLYETPNSIVGTVIVGAVIVFVGLVVKRIESYY